MTDINFDYVFSLDEVDELLDNLDQVCRLENRCRNHFCSTEVESGYIVMPAEVIFCGEHGKRINLFDRGTPNDWLAVEEWARPEQAKKDLDIRMITEWD